MFTYSSNPTAARGCSWVRLAAGVLPGSQRWRGGTEGRDPPGAGGNLPQPCSTPFSRGIAALLPDNVILPLQRLPFCRASCSRGVGHPRCLRGAARGPSARSAERASASCSRDLLGGCVACWLPCNGRISHILINTSLAPSSSAPFPKQTGINSAGCLACSGLEGLIPWTWVGALLGQPGRVLGHEAAHPGRAAPHPPVAPQPPGALPSSACGGALAAVPSAQLTPAWFPVSWAPSTLPASSCAPAGHSPSPGHGRATRTRGGPAAPQPAALPGAADHWCP